MRIVKTLEKGRRGWLLENGKLSVFLMQGGGHIARLGVKGVKAPNPFWTPSWKTREPWTYKPAMDKVYGSKLLAAISGHNVCLGFFGGPSSDEGKQGLVCHGEAPVSRWSLVKRSVSARALSLTYGCTLPVAQMRLLRTVKTGVGSSVLHVREEAINLSKRDLPFTMCQHVSFGAPFVEPDVTLFDMPATKGHTFPEVFNEFHQRLKVDAAYVWPNAPGVKAKWVNLRTMSKGVYGDFHANLIDPHRRMAWFSAVHPGYGLMVAYVWSRADYPWVGVWEESHGRPESPWNKKNLVRGMEFGNSPFPLPLRRQVDLGRFHGMPTYRWLPAKGRVVCDYAILALPVDRRCRGVNDIQPGPAGFEVKLKMK